MKKTCWYKLCISYVSRGDRTEQLMTKFPLVIIFLFSSGPSVSWKKFPVLHCQHHI